MPSANANKAMKSTPGKSYQERLEQALLWATWELESDQGGHGGLLDAISDVVPEFKQRDLIKKGYPQNWPESYDGDDLPNPDDHDTYRL